MATLRAVATLTIVTTFAAACVFRRLVVTDAKPEEGVAISAPVRAHLEDGGVVLFRTGFVLRDGVLHGEAEVYDALLESAGTVSELPLEGVVAFETYRAEVEGEKSVLVSVAGTAAGLVGGVVLAKAIFGSCPTVYSTGEDGPRLEAEAFSYSIAPLLEGRDLDPLRGAQPDPQGRVTLEVRNEALETHYIDHLALIEVVHGEGERALPDQEGRATVVGSLHPIQRALDRSGRDVTARLRGADGDDYRSPRAALHRAAESGRDEDLADWIELDFVVPPGAGQPALVVSARNSLLITVLFYDIMLARAGVRALDWLGRDLEQISTTVKLGRWIQQHSGLRVQMWRDGAWRRVDRLPDSGPIAQRQAVVTLPDLPPGPTKLRLAFLTDGWRIDEVAVGRSRPATTRTLAAADLRDAAGRSRFDALERLAAPDASYLVTHPGQRFEASFDAGPLPSGRSRSFLLASQGYYTEWIRGDWVRRAGAGTAFEPSNGALRVALGRWRTIQPDFERDFAKLRVPVR